MSIDMNKELIKNSKNSFEKDLLQLIINAVFEKAMENVRSHRNIKLIATKPRRNYLVPKKILYNKKCFRYFISNRNKKTQIIMSKPLHLGLLIL